MKRRVKSYLPLLLAAVLLAGSMPLTASAADRDGNAIVLKSQLLQSIAGAGEKPLDRNSAAAWSRLMYRQPPNRAITIAGEDARHGGESSDRESPENRRQVVSNMKKLLVGVAGILIVCLFSMRLSRHNVRRKSSYEYRRTLRENSRANRIHKDDE